MISKKHFDKIEAYLRQELTEVEKADFEKAVSEDEELALELETHKLEHEVMRQVFRDDLKSKMRTWDQEKENPAATRVRVRRLPLRGPVWIGAAAAILLLLIGFVTLRWVNNNYSDTALAQSFFELPEMSIPDKGPAEGESTISPGVALFRAGDYTGAIAFFRQVPPDDPAFSDAQFIIGQSEYQMGDYGAAAGTFRNLTAAGRPALREMAEWYYLLARLAGNNFGESELALLRRIADNPSHNYHPQAVRLSEELSSFWRRLQ